MTIYILAYIFMLILAIYSKKHNNNKKVFCLIIFIIWATILGLRHPSMGIDLAYGSTGGYWGMYKVIGTSSWQEAFHDKFFNYEQGYVVFNKILYTFFDNPQFLLIVSAILAMGAIMWLIYKYSKAPLLSVILYLSLPIFLINFSGIRQCISIAITIYSFRFIKEKKLIPFAVMVLLANWFHSSAIIFLAAYPIYYIKTQKSFMKVGSIILLPIVYMFRVPIFNMLASLLGENDRATSTNAFMLFAFFTIIYIFCLVFEDLENQNQVGYRNLFYTACICQIFGGVSNTAIRIGYYFMIYLVLLFPEIIVQKNDNEFTETRNSKLRSVSNSNSMIMYITVFTFFMCWGLYSLSNATWAEANPHSFFWQS